MGTAAEWLRYLGPGAMFVLGALAGVGLPVPATPAFVLAGAWVAQGRGEPWVWFLAGAAGSVLGDGVAWWLGRRGEAGVHDRISRRRLWRRARGWFERHADVAVFVSRFPLGWLQFPTALLAGAARFSVARFLAVGLPAHALWVASAMAAGYYGLSRAF